MPARISCLIIFILELIGLYKSFTGGGGIKNLIYYTVLSNIVNCISVLMTVIFGQPGWVTVVRYLGTCMLIFTIMVTTFVLVPAAGSAKSLLFGGSGLFVHLICPILSTISYIFIEEHVGAVFILLPVAITLVYGFIMLYLNGIRKVDGPYPFFRVHDQTVKATVIWMVVLAFSVGALCALLWLCGTI